MEMNNQRAASDSSSMLIVAYVVYMSLMTYMMFVLYGDNLPLFKLTSFDSPSWFTVISGQWLVWVFEVIANFFILLTFTIGSHGIPVWMNMFFTVPLVLGVGWTVLELIRG
jgi:hypothetical protein